ncbi:MAG: hypothetical protein V1776_04280 [Candidatus Diapherotrites archaeon]
MSDTIAAEAKQWGNSISVILDSKLVKKQKINPKDKLIITVQRVNDIKELRGTFKSKRSTQDIMNEIRKGWD